MKQKIYKIIMILSVPVLFYLIMSGFKETDLSNRNEKTDQMLLSTNPQKKFINCIYNNDYYGLDVHAKWSIYDNIPRYIDSLNFNSIQIYGGIQGGAFDTALSRYSSKVTSLMNALDTSGLNVLYGRDKISKLCYGQRLEYEAEGGNNGFSYSRRNADTITDRGRIVIHACSNSAQCPETDASPRYLCDSIYENLQHSNIIADYFSDADAGEWYLKPEMRIKQSDFSIIDTRPVIAIVTKNFLGGTSNSYGDKDSIIIRVNNFRNGNSYDGNYTNKYTFQLGNDSLKISGNQIDGLNAGRDDDNLDLCKVDFKIYWFGQVDVWFDKLIVDDEMGNELFSGINDYKVIEEIDAFKSSNLHTSNYAYYVDEMVYSNIPCIKRVTDLMDSIDSGSRLTCATTNYLNTRGLRNDILGNRLFFQKLNPELFTNDAHEIPGIFPDNLTLTEPVFNQVAISASINSYQQELQNRFGDKNRTANENQGSLVHQINFAREQRNLYAPNAQFIMQPQLHSFFIHKLNDPTHEWSGIREPTNEEIQTQAMLTIAHGADGIGWVSYQSTFEQKPDDINPIKTITTYGMLNIPGYPEATPRLQNIFGQNKWAYVGNMNRKIKHWTPTLDMTKWTSGYSVHSETATHEFISDIKSLKRDPAVPYSLTNEDAIKYWEMGFFEPDFNNPAISTNDMSKYFIMVNRRCVPDTPVSGHGDFRELRIKFNPDQLSGVNNWKIIELDSNNVVATFDKNATSYINMGEFKPGEGKLYKLVPVMQEGGTLIADEEVSGSFDCNGEVNNNGKNITLNLATTIYFSNINARIKMNGGNFKSGSSNSYNSTPVYLKGKDDNYWKGLSLQNCSRVEIFSTYFQDVSPYRLDSTYAVDMINCEFVNVSGSSFKSDNANNTGGIRGSYSVNNDRDFNTYISNNQFLLDAGNIPAVSIISTGGLVFPIIMENNNFDCQSTNSLNAIFVNNISGGAIKNNNISGYKNGVIMLSSSLDFYGNIINGSYDNSIGIQAFSESNVGLGNNGNFYLAGLNEILSDGANAKCVFVEKSYFDIYKAENIFDLKNYQAGQAYHFYGDFPSKPGNEPVKAFGNCFKVSGTNTNVVKIVKWITGDPINFEFEPYNCEIEKPEGKLVVDLGEGMIDTIYYESEGSGGGNREFGFKKDIMEIGSMKSIMDSININIRKRNYEKVNTDCRTILNNYSDSLQSGGVISKLYLADLRLDSSGNRISDLKSYLESLILNNNENELLIKQAFYYIQKCKVSLGDYASAMTGFQQIIDQNPYSYEGLVASWDYASASLLLSGQGGSGGGVKDNDELRMTNYPLREASGFKEIKEIEDLEELKTELKNRYLTDDPNIKDNYDTKTFTKEDRKIIRENVFKSYETSREKETAILKTLEKKVSDGIANENEKSELTVKRTLNELIKSSKPKNINEHINKMNSNIEKVFGINYDNSVIAKKGIIPIEFNLSQNYPNPFNPTTNLEFQIPKSQFVTLKIYDLLGKEIVTIVNENLNSGTYRYKFNGSNLASGVYFYKLVAGDFTAVKRMVLVK